MFHFLLRKLPAPPPPRSPPPHSEDNGADSTLKVRKPSQVLEVSNVLH